MSLSGTGFTTGVSGITFQWEESDDNGVGDAWANAVGGTGATTSSYTSPTLSGNIFYRLRVSCTASGLSAVTNSAAITAANCQFNIARNTGTTYSSIMSTGSTYTTLNAVTNLDDNITNTVSLAGTSFTYKGQPVTGFRSSTNGWMTFNTATTSTAFSNNIGTNATTAVLAPFWEDLICTGWTSGAGTQAMLNGSMRYQVNGTLGSGTAQIIIEWAGMETFGNPGPNLNFQVVLNEAGNTITYNYGTMEGFNGSLNYGYAYTIGMNGWSFTTPGSFTDVQAQRDDNTTNFDFTPATTANSGLNARLYLPVCNSQLVFTPTAAYGGPGSAPTIVPANDEATTATSLTVNGAPCTSFCSTYYRNQGGTASAGIAACTAVTPGTPDDDVWFSFVATTTGAVITVRGGGGMDPVVQLFSDQGITALNCVNATGAGLSESITNTSLTAGSTYWVRVYHAGTGADGLPTTGFTTAGIAQFSICVNEVVPPPANDDICGAVNLNVNATCVTTAGNTLNATASSQAVCGGTADDDIWFRFTAATTGDVITVQGATGYNAHLQVFSSSDQTCSGALTSLTCTNATSTGGAETYSGPWTVGNTYFVRVYHTGTGAATGAFTICVTATAPACATGLSPANAAIICGNASPVNITWSATSGASGYDVYFDAGAGPATTQVGFNQPGTTYNAGALAFGQYTYRIVPRNGIGAATGCTDVTFNVNAVPTATITASGPTTFCTPGSVDLTASAGGSYLWAPGGATTQTITVSTSGSYTVQVTTAGCSATSLATVVTVNQSPTITGTTATPTAICAGGTSQLQVNTPPPSAYCTSVAFTSGVEAISNVTFADINNSSACAIGVAAGGAIQDFTSVVGNVVAGSSYTITVTGTTDGSFTNFFTAFFDWNQDGVFEAQQAIGSITNTACVLTASTSITVPVGALNGNTRMRVIKVFNSSPTNPCGTYGYGQAEDYTLSVTGGAPAFTYSWNNAGSLNDATIANPIATPAVTTNYQVTVTAGNGCPATGSVQVNVQAAPNAGSNGSLTICAGSTVTAGQLFASLGGTPDPGGSWSPALAGAGVYTYTVTATAPCVVNATATVTVTEQTAPNAGSNGALLTCINGAPTNLFSQLGGSPDATGTWSGPSVLTGGNLGTFTPPAAAGVYTYTVAGTAPCANASATVTVTYDNTDSDGDNIIDCIDNCPNFPGQNGDACDAGPNFVLGTIVNCACVGQQCTTDLVLEFDTDANTPTHNTWELRASGSNILVQSGSGLPGPVNNLTVNTCLPDGCYYLRVLDTGGDGIANGGYILRTLTGAQRIIDNRDNFSTGSVSAVVGNGGFCLPLGTDKLIFTSCDKLDWVNNQFIVAAENPAVSAQFGVNDANSGYQFWWFDPNGTYGYTKFRSHATSDGFGTGATRACHARINNWSPNQIPWFVLMNVKVRGRVNGVNSNWGPVCRFKIDPTRAACPLTKLMDIPGNVNFSCGVTRPWGSGAGSQITARPVTGATQYQFRFVNGEIPGGVVRTTTTPTLQLNWSPALNDGTYEVQVRAFKNGQWCVTSLPWGDACNVTITGSPNAMVLDGGPTTSTGDVKLALFPNPNNGQQLTVSLSSVAAGVEVISVDIFDLNGARVSAQVIAVNDGMVYQVVDVAGLADGLYMVNIHAGAERYTERLVIAK